MRRPRIIAMLLLAASAAAGCDREASPPAAVPLPALRTITVAASPAADARGWDGVVEAVRRAQLTAQTGGRVTQVLADVDSRVPAGAVLVRLAGVEQQAGANTARAQLRAAEAAAVEADRNYRRYAALADGRYVAKAQVDDARAGRDTAVAARDAARAQLAQAAQQTDYTVVRAPFAGVVAQRHVEPGESVAPGQPLVTLYVPGDLRIEVQVPQSQADAIRAAGKARITLANGDTIDARRVIVFPTADVATHSVGVRLDLPAMPRPPVPGTSAKVSFPIRVPAAAVGSEVSIPASALVQRGELSGAYVVEGDRLLLRQLRVGGRDGERVVVIAGLRPGERIAADPVAALQALHQQRAAMGAAGG